MDLSPDSLCSEWGRGGREMERFFPFQFKHNGQKSIKCHAIVRRYGFHSSEGTRPSWPCLAFSPQWWVNPWETTSQRLTTWLKHTYPQHGHNLVTGRKVSDIRSFQALREKQTHFWNPASILIGRSSVKHELWMKATHPLLIPRGVLRRKRWLWEKHLFLFQHLKLVS